jgi:hypothetical protein
LPFFGVTVNVILHVPFFVAFIELRTTLHMVFEEVETTAVSRDPLGTVTRYFFAIADTVIDLPTVSKGEVPTTLTGILMLD